jgi:UDP-N-acetylglucosamine 1-carboxyvinyltransferase
MDKLIIEGGRRLHGELAVSGSKNATLPIIAATLLAPGQYRLTHVPHLRDIRTMASVLRVIGARVELKSHTLSIDTSNANLPEAPYELVKTMRASFYVLGPLLARFRRARVSLPGGCAWGPRPVDLHLKGMEALGATMTLDGGYILAEAGKLRGSKFFFPISSVGATGNVMMAAVLAEGETILENAAIEPDITALAEFLVRMGANIKGVGTTTLRIRGVEALRPTDAEMIPDRIEAGSFVAAVGICGGEVTLTGANPDHMQSVINAAMEAGIEITQTDDSMQIKADGKPQPLQLTTAPYPGFPTDLQAPFMALLSVADGNSSITDTIYEDRFAHVPELVRLGANINLVGNCALIEGVEELQGAPVMSTDIRASVSLVLAGLRAQGRTEVLRVYHLDRGYEKIETKLSGVDAKIWREEGAA